MQENCNAILVSPQVNELNVACHGNVELTFERERPRNNGGKGANFKMGWNVFGYCKFANESLFILWKCYDFLQGFIK